MRWVTAMALVLASCGSEDVLLRATVAAVDETCRPEPPTRLPIGSIRVQVVEYSGGRRGDVLSEECFRQAQGTTVETARDVLDLFDDRGYVASGIPADVPSRVQLIGFGGPTCPFTPPPLGPVLCGVTVETLTDSTFSDGNAVAFAFSCASSEEPSGLYRVCLAVGSVPGLD